MRRSQVQPISCAAASRRLAAGRFGLAWLLVGAFLCGGVSASAGPVPDPVAHTRELRVADGAAVHAWLGVMTHDLTQSLAETLGLDSTDGAYVAAVMAGSAADVAGLEPGDVITRVDGVPVLGSVDLSLLMAWTAPGDTVRLTYWRDRSACEVDVELGHARVSMSSPHVEPSRPTQRRYRTSTRREISSAASRIIATPLVGIDRAQTTDRRPA